MGQAQAVQTSRVGDDVAVVALDEPARRNPLSPALVAGLTSALRGLHEDDSVRAVVLHGNGPGFSAGADLRRMRNATAMEDREEYDRILELNELLWTYAKPTIAAVHGFAFGAGANLMNWCDLVVVDADARIGYPEVKAGVPSATVIPTLQRLLGRRKLLELTLLGEPISGVQAVEFGIANRAVAPGTALTEALALAEQLAQRTPQAIAMTKYIVRSTEEMAYREAMTFAKEVRVIARLQRGFEVVVPQGGSASVQESF